MFPRLALTCLTLLLAGCLPDGLPVDGRSLFRGRTIERPGFINVGGKPFVVFEVRTNYPMGDKAGASDLWMTGWDEGGPRVLLMANKSDRWPVDIDGARLRYIMHDERTLDDGTPGGARSPVATLSRVSLSTGVVDSIEDVTDYSLAYDLLVYRKITPGVKFRELHLRQVSGHDRLVARDTGLQQVGGLRSFYYTEGDDRVLRRLTSLEGPVETFRSHVVGFTLTDDEKYAILNVVEAGQRQSLVYHMATRTERALPGKPCCWLGFVELPAAPAEPTARRWQFMYSESAQGEMAGRMHLFDLDTGEDIVTPLVPGLSDVSAIIARPKSDASLLVDSQGRLAHYVPGGEPSMRLLEVKALSPVFTGDGRFLIYVQPETLTPMPEGKLMVQDADFLLPPRVLSPRGTSISPGDYFFIQGAEPLVFWAHFGRDASNLYFADPDSGSARVVAEGIREVSVTPSRVVGIIRVSAQDLVGDLVQKSTTTGEEQLLAHSVSDVAVTGFDPAIEASRVAFVVHERVDTGRDGLWATTLRMGQ